MDDYERYINKLGINTLEVSDGSMSIPHDEKCEVIAKYAKNYKVLSEVGSLRAMVSILQPLNSNHPPLLAASLTTLQPEEISEPKK